MGDACWRLHTRTTTRHTTQHPPPPHSTPTCPCRLPPHLLRVHRRLYTTHLPLTQRWHPFRPTAFGGRLAGRRACMAPCLPARHPPMQQATSSAHHYRFPLSSTFHFLARTTTTCRRHAVFFTRCAGQNRHYCAARWRTARAAPLPIHLSRSACILCLLPPHGMPRSTPLHTTPHATRAPTTTPAPPVAGFTNPHPTGCIRLPPPPCLPLRCLPALPDIPLPAYPAPPARRAYAYTAPVPYDTLLRYCRCIAERTFAPPLYQQAWRLHPSRLQRTTGRVN